MHTISILVVASAFSLALFAVPNKAKTGSAVEADSISPFHIKIPDAALVDLRRRIAATWWPDPETVNDRSQGVQLATMQELVRLLGHGV